MRWAQSNYSGIEILLSSQGARKKNLEGLLQGYWARSSLSMYILGLRPKPRTRGRPRRSKHYQGSLCQQMKNLVLVIMTKEGRPMTNVSLDRKSRGSNRWSAIQGNLLGSSIDTNKHCRNIGQGGILKYLRRKLLPPY